MPALRQVAREPDEVLAQTVSFTVPLLPPSVNHYKRPSGRKIMPDGSSLQMYTVSAEAKAYKAAIAIFARGETVAPATAAERDRVRYALYVRIVLGKGQTGDGDNFWKCVGDGLVEAGVIHSDARVLIWHLEKVENERQDPRTEITVTRMEPRR